MNRFYYIFVAMLAALCIAFTSARANAQDAYVPNGLNGPSDIVSGIFPGSDPASCCWMGAHGAFDVRVPSGADTLLVTIVEPDYAVSRKKQSLRVQIDHGAVYTQCCFGAGEFEFAFPVPRNTSAHPLVRVRLTAGTTFVPKDVGINQDPRRLSFLLRGVAFSNSATGERFADSSAGELQTAPLAWLIAGGIIILLLTLRRPFYGAAALILTDPFLLAHATHGTTITLPKVALIAVALGIIPRLRRSSLSDARTLGLLLAAQLLFVLSMAGSSLHALDHGAALRETLKAVEYAATLLVAYLAYRPDPDETLLRWCFSVAALIVSGLALSQEFLTAPQSEMIAGHNIARIAGPLEGPNQLAGYLGVLVPVMLAFAVLRPRLLLERIAIIVAAAACVLTFSKAGVAALILGVAVLFAVRYASAHRKLAAACTAVAFGVLFALAAASFSGVLHGSTDRIFGSTDAGARFNGGLGVRSDLWHGAYALWRSRPLAGIGPGNFENQVGRYDPGVHTHANSMYFQVLAEQGVAGFIALLVVVAASIGVFVRRLHHPLALGACVAALAMAFHQIVDCMWIYPKVGVMWWVLLAFAAAAVDLSAGSEYVAEQAVA